MIGDDAWNAGLLLRNDEKRGHAAQGFSPGARRLSRTMLERGAA